MTRREGAAGRLFTTLVLALVLRSAPVLADDEVDPRSLQAERLAEEANATEAAGEHQRALDLYLRAQELAPAAAILFDVAFIYDRRLEKPLLAADFYRRSLAAADVSPELADRARARIAELERRGSSSDALDPSRAAEGAARPQARWGPMKIAGLGLGAVGLAGLGASGVLGLLAKSKDEDAERLCNGDRCVDPHGLELTDAAVQLTTAANITFVAGAVLLAAGATLLLLPSAGPSSGARNVRLPWRGLAW